MNNKPVNTLGFWAAILTALLSVAWVFAMFGVQQIVAPMPEWRGAAAYAGDFRPLHLLNLYPSLFLALTFLVLMACIHLHAPSDKKVWSLIALLMAVVYATMASINYNIQLVAVRWSLLSGESEGMAMFPQANPHSIFWALANAYVYMCLAMLFAAPVFAGGGLERWIRRLLIGAGLVAPAQLAVTVFDLSGALMLVAGPLWFIGLPAVSVLLAVLFRRGARSLEPAAHVGRYLSEAYYE